MYIIDLLAGYTPFLNTTNVCTYPDAKRSKRTRQFKDMIDKNVIMLNNSMYEGQYGNFGHGNLSFVTDQSTGRLQLHYGEIGVWNLFADSTNYTFNGQGVGHVWFKSLSDISFGSFNSLTQVMDKVTIHSFEPNDPPTFERSLDITDAPDPDTPC